MHHEQHPNTLSSTERPTVPPPGLPRPAPEREIPDWRRFQVAANRYSDYLAAGISAALAEHRLIDQDTARCIAHILGRSLTQDSALTKYGRTGEGDYEILRDEYLALRNTPEATESVRDLIDHDGSIHVFNK